MVKTVRAVADALRRMPALWRPLQAARRDHGEAPCGDSRSSR